MIDLVRLRKRPVAEDHPEGAARIEGQMGKLGKARGAAIEDSTQVRGGRLHAAIGIDAQADLSRVVKTTAARRGADFGEVLAPILIGFIPGDPDAILAIDRDRASGTAPWVRWSWRSRRPASSVEGAEIYIVVAGLVAIPGDPGSSRAVERDCGIPIVRSVV